LHCTELLRKVNVVGKFVEYHGEGAATLSATDRATIANMSPEYGATMGFSRRRRDLRVLQIDRAHRRASRNRTQLLYRARHVRHAAARRLRNTVR